MRVSIATLSVNPRGRGAVARAAALAAALALLAAAPVRARGAEGEADAGTGDAEPPSSRLVLEERGLVPVPTIADPVERAVALGVPSFSSAGQPPPLLSPRRPAVRVLTPAAESLALQGVIMGWNRYVGDARWATVTPDTVHQNLRSRWVLDDNAFFVNQLGHPYQGTFSYTAARSSGLGFWTASAFPFAASALWEVAGETEQPAINDQITTTVAGIVLGEVLWRTADWVRGDGRSWWRTGAATLLAPMSTLNRRVMPGNAAPPPQAVRLEAAAGVHAETSRPAGEPATPTAAMLGVALTHGVPGDADFSFARPFDHFDARFAFSPGQDPAMSLRARGLLAGTDFASGARGGGLAGLWLGFDLESPGPSRISTSALGLGATGRWTVLRGVDLEGTAIGSAVLLGAAGEVARAPGSDRDYRMGPGAQGLVDLAVTAGDRVRAGVTLRQYLVLGAGDQTGSDLLLDGAVTARVRLIGQHGLQASASHFLRTARDVGTPQVRQEGSSVVLSWVYAVDPPPPGARFEDEDPDA